MKVIHGHVSPRAESVLFFFLRYHMSVLSHAAVQWGSQITSSFITVAVHKPVGSNKAAQTLGNGGSEMWPRFLRLID